MASSKSVRYTDLEVLFNLRVQSKWQSSISQFSPQILSTLKITNLSFLDSVHRQGWLGKAASFLCLEVQEQSQQCCSYWPPGVPCSNATAPPQALRWRKWPVEIKIGQWEIQKRSMHEICVGNKDWVALPQRVVQNALGTDVFIIYWKV